MDKKASGMIIMFVILSIFVAAMNRPKVEARNEVKNDTIPETQVMTTSCGVRYEKVHAYGHEFIVFSNGDGTDIEVFHMTQE